MVEPGIEPGTLMISSQRPWPLDHEAGHLSITVTYSILVTL